MKLATKNPKQNSLTNFFIKLPKKEVPLKDCSNILKDNSQVTDQNVIINLESPQKRNKNHSQNLQKKSPSKRKNEFDVNNSDLKKKRVDSPLKSTPKQKTIDEFNFNDIQDEFDVFSFEREFSPSNLDLTKLERYKIENIEVTSSTDLKLTVQSLVFHNKGHCIIKSPWNACSLHAGDIISLKGRCTEYGDWVVDWNGGVLVTDPDRLISGTTIVNSLYCSRKTVLSHLFKEQEGIKKSSAMFVGCLVHELLQEVLTSRLTTLQDIEKLFNKIKDSKEFKVQLFLENYKLEDIIEEITHFVPRIYDFVCKYVNQEDSKAPFLKKSFVPEKIKKDWQGEIVDVKDIEENIWSHKLGIKGKVDATVLVNINNKIKTMPLELKTGKVSPLNLEHRGQVILYCMMLKELGENVDSGLLLYLRDEGHMIDVKYGDKEHRDLILLRNGLSDWLKNLSLVDAGPNMMPPRLPKVINRTTCQSCPQLLACSSALRRSGDIERLKDNHILKTLAVNSTSHLTDQHLEYVFHWIGLLSLELEMSKFSVSRIWSIKPEEREAKGWCVTQMKISSSTHIKGRRHEVVFVKLDESPIVCCLDSGQTIVVSNDSHIAIAMGTIKEVTLSSIIVKLEKDIKGIIPPICLDSYESNSINLILMNNLGLLLNNTNQAEFLRQTVIEQKIPTFAPKLSSKIKRIGQDIFDRLNKEQVRAILQAVAAEKYILIRGMPGAGKTTTMRALIELLFRLGKRVMVTSFTHSAVDNILLALPLLETGNVLRLGPTKRIHPLVARYASEEKLLQDLGENITVQNLEETFGKRRIVGVTCLGCGHAWLERQRFDVCLVDEATQVTQPAVLKPLYLAEKFILVGDPKQLYPLVLCPKAKENGLGVSLFEKLDRPAVTSHLTLQYRMNKFITQLANNFAYEGQLKCGTEQVALNTLTYNDEKTSEWPEWIKLTLDKSLEKSVIVVDVVNKVESNSGFFENKAEANVILEITKALQQVDINLKSVGVIATYRDQVNSLRNLLHSDIEVNTVDQYQGRDKELILFSTTKKSKTTTSNDILNDMNRLTVAITRAKKKLVIIGNIAVLRNYTNLTKLLDLIPSKNITQFRT